MDDELMQGKEMLQTQAQGILGAGLDVMEEGPSRNWENGDRVL